MENSLARTEASQTRLNHRFTKFAHTFSNLTIEDLQLANVKRRFDQDSKLEGLLAITACHSLASLQLNPLFGSLREAEAFCDSCFTPFSWPILTSLAPNFNFAVLIVSCRVVSNSPSLTENKTHQKYCTAVEIQIQHHGDPSNSWNRKWQHALSSLRACSNYAKFCLICQKICQREATSIANDFLHAPEAVKIFVRRENPLFLDIHPLLGSHDWVIAFPNIWITKQWIHGT